MRATAAGGALAVLACAWLTPLAAGLLGPFSAHMATHMAVVAAAAPLLAVAIAGTGLDPLRRLPAPLLAIPASLVELLVVWGWHAPALHDLARETSLGFMAEQSTFFVSALFVWLSVLAPERRAAHSARDTRNDYEPGSTSATGVVALLLTSMHMTLLGALLALAPRPLYHAHAAAALADQHFGGALMLAVGGAVYLAGGLALAAKLVKKHRFAEPNPQARGAPS
jgi:putative membrane protein